MPPKKQKVDAMDTSDSGSVSGDVDDADVEAALVALGQDWGALDGMLASQWQARASRKRQREGADQDGKAKRAATGTGASQRSPEAQACVNQAFVKYGDGQITEAIELARHAVQLEPGDPEPFKVLAVIYREKGDMTKELAALEMVGYLSRHQPRAEVVSTWRRIALLAQKLKKADTAIDALQRSLGARDNRTSSAEDVEARWQLANLYFQREDGAKSGIGQLLRLYRDTRDVRWAKEAARKYVRLLQWRQALELLEGALEAMRSQHPPVVDLDVVNMLCEVLLDRKQYGKCASILVDVFDLAPTQQKARSDGKPLDARSILAYFENQSPAEFTKKLRKLNADLAAKLGASLCQLHKLDSSEIGEACTTCIDMLLACDPQEFRDVYLMAVQCFVDIVASHSLEDTGAESVAQPLQSRYTLTKKTAEYALKLIQRLSESEACEDLREQEGLALWQLGQVAEGAAMLEEAITDMRVPKTELELRRLRVRAAEAWTQAGQPQRASAILSQMTYADLQNANVLPHPLSIEERMALFSELKTWIEGYHCGDNALDDVDSVEEFVKKFLCLVRDCEMDYERLSQHSSGNAVVRPALMDDADATAPLQLTNKEPEQADDSNVKDEEESERKLSTTSQTACTKYEEVYLPGYEMPSTVYKWKRHFLGLESIEDRIGPEGYFDFIMNGVDIAQEFAERHFRDGTDLEEATRCRISELSRCVEVCEKVISHRKLASQRNPTRRQALKGIAVRSLAMAFKARLWRTVFLHLRLFCDVREDDRPVLLSCRALFAHGEDELLAGRQLREPGDNFLSAQPAQPVQEAEWRRETYMASLTDARSWAMRKLRDNPNSFAFTMLAAHFCVAASSYKHAVPEYIRAHQASPCDPLAALCLATSYLSLAMSRTVLYRHDMILKAFSLLQWYRRLRAGDLMNILPGKSMFDELVHAAEASYNFGRAFHQLSIDHLALTSYEQSLQYMAQAETQLQNAHVNDAERSRCDMVTVKSCCTWNMALLLKAHNAHEKASALLRKHIVF